MKVILLQELKGKGGEGDVVDVAPGFANNYLLPQNVDRRRIELGHAIKTAGQHEVTISLYRDIKTTVKLFVGGADDEVAPAEAEVVEETIEEVVEAPAEETAEAAE